MLSEYKMAFKYGIPFFLTLLMDYVILGHSIRYKFDPHPCWRDCTGEVKDRMTCGYNFSIENYWTQSLACDTTACTQNGTACDKNDSIPIETCIPANGIRRGIVVANRMLPGPSIRVCEGDRILVDVENRLRGQEVTIHWNGISQRGTPWFDGVTGLTQCPISVGATFRYDFEAESAGTFAWHAYSDFQRIDGLFGSLIVRKAVHLNGNGKIYDSDLPQHEIIISEWLNDLSLPQFFKQQYMPPGDEDLLLQPRGILINGRGFPPNYFDAVPNSSVQNFHGFHGLHEVHVEQGNSYRFRFISNAISDCPIEISVQNHEMLVVASDGNDLNPMPVSSLVILAGERWDVVLQARHAVGSYWIKFRQHEDCAQPHSKAFQLAVLHYNPIPVGCVPDKEIQTWEDAGASLVGNAPHLNPLTLGLDQKPWIIGLKELDSVEEDAELHEEIPAHQFYVSIDFKNLEDLNFEKPRAIPHISILRNGSQAYLPQLNFISNLMPAFPGTLMKHKRRASTNAANGVSEKVADSLPDDSLLNATSSSPAHASPVNGANGSESVHGSLTTNTLGRAETSREAPFCNSMSLTQESRNCNGSDYCHCTHVLEVKLYATVELVLVNRLYWFFSGAPFESTPVFHLHGNRFRVVAIQKLSNSTATPDEVKRMDEQGLIQRRTKNAPIKDTAAIPSNGFTILRFQARNPGFWLLRPTTQFLGEFGMSLIFKVGSHDEMTPPPPHFPECGNYQPPVSDVIAWNNGPVVLEEPTITTTTEQPELEVEEPHPTHHFNTTRPPIRRPGGKNGGVRATCNNVIPLVVALLWLKYV